MRQEGQIHPHYENTRLETGY